VPRASDYALNLDSEAETNAWSEQRSPFKPTFGGNTDDSAHQTVNRTSAASPQSTSPTKSLFAPSSKARSSPANVSSTLSEASPPASELPGSNSSPSRMLSPAASLPAHHFPAARGDSSEGPEPEVAPGALWASALRQARIRPGERALEQGRELRRVVRSLLAKAGRKLLPHVGTWRGVGSAVGLSSCL
jgi:hypothetical protein